MDEKVNTFLKEIGEFEPSDSTIMPSNTRSCSWQECFDDTTGYPYYWNMETNAVTWEMPNEYKITQTGPSNPKMMSNRKNAGTSSAPRCSTAPSKPSRNADYQPSRLVYRTSAKDSRKRPHASKRQPSESDDEKIELITSYGEDSDSETEAGKDQHKSKRDLPRPSQPLPKVPLGPTIIYRIQPENQVIYPSSQSKTGCDSLLLDYNLKAPPLVLQSIVNKIQKDLQDNLPKPTEPDTSDCLILHRLRTQAKVLQDLGGEVPQEIEKLIKPDTKQPIDDIIAQIEREQPPDQPKLASKSLELPLVKPNIVKPLVSLVAGYSDESDEEEEDVSSEPEPTKTLFPISETEPVESSMANENVGEEETVSYPGMLVTDKIDNNAPEVKQLEQPNKNTYLDNEIIDELRDTKAFKRKRRIALDVLPTKLKKTEPLPSPSGVYMDPVPNVHTGFGFQQKKDDQNSPQEQSVASTNKYKKGAISFVKAETINGSNDDVPIPDETKRMDDEDIDGLEEMATVVQEKVLFLGEGKEPVSAVQLMMIQLETLLAARKANGLTNAYLHTWLKATATDLGKLERDATPAGWLCQWDRSNKRYFYRNQQTGQSQWEYPDAGIAGGAEAMDICTTPPPADDDMHPVDNTATEKTRRLASPTVEPVAIIGPAPQTPPPPTVSPPPQPPPPPQITERSPSPPPPPKISHGDDSGSNTILSQDSDLLPPLPSSTTIECLPTPPTVEAEPFPTTQPLPPGVDPPELPYIVAGPTSVGSDSTKYTVNSIQESSEKSLGSELESFYSDIASLDVATANAVELPTEVQIDTMVSNSTKPPKPDVEMASVENKKKKKTKVTKLASGLTLKKKEVSLLVEKWKKVQNDF